MVRDLELERNLKKCYYSSFLLSLFFLPYLGQLLLIVGSYILLSSLRKLSINYNNVSIFNNYLLGIVLILIDSILPGIFHIVTKKESIHLWFIVWLLLIFGTFFIRRSLMIIHGITGVKRFKTSGNLLFIGSCLSFILIGFLLMFLGFVYQAISFKKVIEK